MSSGSFAIRTVVIPHRLEPALFRALLDLRRGVNRLVRDWRSHPDESRFTATKRSYPALRRAYPHLAAGWCITMANETSAVLGAWDRSLRRARAHDPERFDRMRRSGPHRRQLKASLHGNLYRWDPARRLLDITVRHDLHVVIELASVRHPLFEKYGAASEWRFGLTLRPNSLLFHFRVPHDIEVRSEDEVGIDLNFDSADLATSDGVFDRVDLQPIQRVQESMARKRKSIQRHLAKDLRHQRSVLRRYHRRETHRVVPLLHRAANEILAKGDTRTLVFEDLTDLTQTVLRTDSRRRGPASNRRLSTWTHGRLVGIVSYKARTPIVWVSSEGASQECPRCGGPLALPSEGRVVVGAAGRRRMTRQVVCGDCGGAWHRDAAAAIAILARGRRLLRGAAVPPSARSALLEAATWRPGPSEPFAVLSDAGPAAAPRREDDAKSRDPQRLPDR